MTPEYQLVDETIYVPIHCHHKGGSTDVGDGEVQLKLNGEVKGSFKLNDSNDKVIDLGNLPLMGNGNIVIKQNGEVKGSFTLNQDGDLVIDLDGGGPTVKPYVYWGHFGSTKQIPVITPDDILTFNRGETTAEGLADFEFVFPAYTENAKGAWGFIAIPDQFLTTQRNDIIFDKANDAFPASNADYSVDNVIINSLPYKIFVTGVLINDPSVFTVRQ
jgi:hypothetical protein